MRCHLMKVEGAFDKGVKDHPFFEWASKNTLSRRQTEMLLAQYWHPLHHFPIFLGGLIPQLPSLELRSHIAEILYMETGMGDPSQAHENLFLKTLRNHGFQPEKITSAPAYSETQSLLDMYRRGTRDPVTGLGVLLSTENTGDSVITQLGEVISQAIGLNKLPWLEAHITQNDASDRFIELKHSFSELQLQKLAEVSQETCCFWMRFLDGIYYHTTANRWTVA